MGGEKFIRRLEEGFPRLGKFDEPGIWERQEKKLEPWMTRKEVIEKSESALAEIERWMKADKDADVEHLWKEMWEEVEMGLLE